jgi:vacuolar-type H+-ATPase subunit C/Vma6
MAPSVDNYAVIHAVTRALYADLLPNSTWQSLIQTPDYATVLDLLSKSIYGIYLDINRPLLTPRRVVYQIRQHLIDVYTKLIRLAPPATCMVLQTLWHHYEVDNIKAALRGHVAGASWDRVLHLLYPMDRHTVVGIDLLRRIVEAPDIEKAVNVLDGLSYHQILVHALTRYYEEQSLFPLEVALDLGYRRLLWDCIFALKGIDHEMALRTIGTVLDSDNLLWAIRYRVYHHLSEEEIINYTLPVGYEVSDDDIRTIARGGDIADVVFKVYPEIKAQLSGVILDTGGGLRQLERALYKLALLRCRKAFIGYPFHIGIPLGYVWLNENEIRDLTIIVEAKAAGTPPDKFGPMLVMANAM